MERTLCLFCRQESVVNQEPFCNESHQHTWEVAGANLLAEVQRRILVDQDFTDQLQVLVTNDT